MTSTATESLARDLTALTLPDTSRVWIYTANRPFTAEERPAIEAHLAAFISSWAAHGTHLAAEAAVLLDQIVVLAVDEDLQMATGCSIDASVAALRGLSETAPSLSDLDLFDRSWVIYRTDVQSSEWCRARLHDFWALRKAGTLSDNTIIVDSTVTTLEQLRTNGVKLLADSWHAHMW